MRRTANSASTPPGADTPELKAWRIDLQDLPTLFEVVEDYELPLELCIQNPVASHCLRLDGLCCRRGADGFSLRTADSRTHIRMPHGGQVIAQLDPRDDCACMALELRDRDGQPLAHIRAASVRDGHAPEPLHRRIWHALLAALTHPIVGAEATRFAPRALEV